jgi:hypothetical protein
MARKNSESFWWVVAAGTVAAVIGGVILLYLVPPMFNAVSSFSSTVLRGISHLVVWFFTASFTFPVWLVVPFFFLSIIFFALFRSDVISRARPDPNRPIAKEDYVRDELDGAIWTWGWHHGQIVNLQPLCPSDLTPMAGYWDVDAYDNRTNLFRCPTCQHATPSLRGGEHIYDDTIRRKIIGKINRDEYKSVVEAQREQTQKRQRMVS